MSASQTDINPTQQIVEPQEPTNANINVQPSEMCESEDISGQLSPPISPPPAPPISPPPIPPTSNPGTQQITPTNTQQIPQVQINPSVSRTTSSFHPEEPGSIDKIYVAAGIDGTLEHIGTNEFPDFTMSPPPASSSTGDQSGTLHSADLSDEDQKEFQVKKRSRRKRWFITLFFEPSVTKDQMIELTTRNVHSMDDKIVSCVACYDETPSTGRMHIHVGVIFNCYVTIETLQRVFGVKNHFEGITGNWEGVVSYIKGAAPKECFLRIEKEQPNSPVFKKPKSAMRTLFEEVVQTKSPYAALAAIQKPGNEIAALHYRSAMNYLKETWRPSLEPVFRVKVYICGAPGSGKTHLAYELCRLGKDVAVTTFSAGGQLVGAHDNADSILFDDLNLSNKNIPHELLFQLLDSYELKVDVKGSILNYSPRLVVVTRCEMPADFVQQFGWTDKETLQFSRRIDYLIRVEKREDLRFYYQVDKETGEETPLDRQFFVFHIKGIMTEALIKARK